MAVELTAESPLAQQLDQLIRPKLIEVGWASEGNDDGALAEYIILMMVNGKTQEQMAAELSGDLLNLGPDDPGARDFSQWLFEQVAHLQQGGSSMAQTAVAQGEAEQDAEMGDASSASGPNVPTGPKSMQNAGRNERGRGGRMLGHLNRNMDRPHDILHKVGGHNGTGRINSHRTPTGPRGGMQIRGRGGNAMGRPNMAAQNNTQSMTPQQQMELFAMLEQQAQMIAQIANGGMPGMPMGGNSFPQQRQGQGPSLFDRVQSNQRQNGFRKAPHQNTRTPQASDNSSSAMDVELTPAHEKPSADSVCRFNLTCNDPSCKFAHQSPAAPPGVAIDVSDTCSFGAACKNRKCTGRHPSPAQKIAYSAEQDCKFYPNCTNPRCAFRHGPPPCRNGADCTVANCKFAHSKIVCKFNPCLNPSCTFKHEDGQKRGKFEDKVWVAGENGNKEHVSERKFVDDNEQVEELIVPGNPAEQDVTTQSELIA